MSSRKKQVIYSLVIVSVIVNLLLLVNVFALRRVNRKYRESRSAFLPRQTEKVARSEVYKMSLSEKNLFDVSYELAKRYEEKADKVLTMREKIDNYTLALMEYSKLPKNNPKYARLVREARERIQPNMTEISTVGFDLGDFRQDVENLYGPPDRQVVDSKFLPSGIITYDYYSKPGLIVGFNNNRVFKIKFTSNFFGSWHGIKVSDSFDKIKTLYPGEKVVLPGNHFGYKVDGLKTTFVFVDGDEKVDGMKVFDEKYYGNWELRLK